MPGQVITCDFSKPTSKRPTLLTRGSLCILAHELGHAIHQLARGDFIDVPWDSIEIMCHLMEHWSLTQQF